MADKTLKTHLKLNGKALCGQKPKKNKLSYVTTEHEVTCERCKSAIKT